MSHVITVVVVRSEVQRKCRLYCVLMYPGQGGVTCQGM